MYAGVLEIHQKPNTPSCFPAYECVCTVQVFKEMADFDVSDVFGVPKDDGHMWWPGLSSKRRRRSSVFPWHWDITKDARFAFTVRKHSLNAHNIVAKRGRKYFL